MQEGGIVVVSDAQDREHEADLIMAAEHITTEQMAFFIQHTSGIICVPMKSERLAELELERLSTNNPSNFDTPFMMPVDLKSATIGGVSAAERTATVRALVDSTTKPEDLGRPGHVFPLMAHPQGLAEREGHTEAGVALMEPSSLTPAAVIGELMNSDGTMMRGQELEVFVEEHHLPHCTIADIIEYQNYA